MEPLATSTSDTGASVLGSSMLLSTPKRDGGMEPDVFSRQLLTAMLGFREGNFSVRLPSDLTGVEGKIADAFNDIVAVSERRAHETARVSRVVGREGKLKQRMSVPGVTGGWADEVAAVNTLIDDLVFPTVEVTRAVGSVAKGDLSQAMPLEVDGRPLEGEFLRSAKLMNKMIDQLSVFTSEVTRVAREVGTEGKLGGQAQVRGVSGVWKDLTDSVNQMAAKLTAQVHNIEDTLRDADRRKNDFLATLAHELRNPLAPIRNAVQILLLKGDPKPELDAARRVIARQTQHLSRLVDDLIDISRITRDKLELRKEQVELGKVVLLAVETSQPLIDEGGHELTVSLPQESIELSADVTRLAQVISILLNNAARYSEPHGRIAVSVTREGSDALVKVKDTGVGIPSTMLPQIFDMFVQVERVRERTSGGLGVGLALAKRLIEMHDGTIEVESGAPGEGSEFTVRLPVRVPAEPQRMLADEHVGAEMTSSLRVLVVDDNCDAVESLSMLLQIMGNDVRTAKDGLEAVNTAREYRPDVVLLDIGLPKLNGYEAAKLMRAESNGRPMVLIALTGWGQEEDRNQSLASGFDHHLVKPVEPSALMKMIVELGPAGYDRPVVAADSSIHVG